MQLLLGPIGLSLGCVAGETMERLPNCALVTATVVVWRKSVKRLLRVCERVRRRRKIVGVGLPSRYSWQVRVKVLYFGVLRDRVGASDEVAELADGATVAALLELLRGRTSKESMGNEATSSLDERLWRSLAVAVNREYGSASIVLRDGDEVALLPPVSGGLLQERENEQC